MRFIKLLKCDIRLALAGQWKCLPALCAGMLLFCMDLYTRVHDMGEIPDMQDYLFFIFGGAGAYEPSPVDPFLFPGIWVCSAGFLQYLLLRYPAEGLNGAGWQFVVRSGSRRFYWISKCVWMVVGTCVLFAACLGRRRFLRQYQAADFFRGCM